MTLEKLVLEHAKAIKKLENTFSNITGTIRALKTNVNDNMITIDQSINENKESIVAYHNSMFEVLNEQNKVFAKGLAQISGTLSSGFELIQTYEEKFEDFREDFKKELFNDIQEFRTSNSTLLNNVSTGIALTELLKSSFVSDESETAIERSASEHKERFVQVQTAIEEKRQLFDKHIEHVFISFFEQFKQISSHILDIQYNIFEKLELSGFFEENDLDKIKKADKLRTKNRQERFKELTQNINDESFSNFSTLRRRIEDELSSNNILHVYASEELENIPVLSIPISLIESNNWDKPENIFIETYGLNKEVDSCYEKIQTKAEFNRYKNFLNKLQSKKYDNRPIESDLLKEIKSGLEKLYKNDYLRHEHYEMVKAHLENYPLKYLVERR